MIEFTPKQAAQILSLIEGGPGSGPRRTGNGRAASGKIRRAKDAAWKAKTQAQKFAIKPMRFPTAYAVPGLNK